MRQPGCESTWKKGLGGLVLNAGAFRAYDVDVDECGRSEILILSRTFELQHQLAQQI